MGAGAFGAHGLAKILSAEKIAIFETAVRYQMFHGLALLALAVLSTRLENWQVQTAGIFFFVGLLLFSGSLYVYVLTNHKQAAMVTPVGGVCFLLGWFFLAWAVLRPV